MAASHTLKISLLHFLLNCISKETSANPDNRNKKLVYDDVKSGKTPFTNGTCWASFDLKILPPVQATMLRKLKMLPNVFSTSQSVCYHAKHPLRYYRFTYQITVFLPLCISYLTPFPFSLGSLLSTTPSL